MLRRAVNLPEEPARHRERYGRNLFGQSLLLGRRLVEAGVPLVQVNSVRFLDRGWDTHADAATMLRDDLLPTLDLALSTLLDDMVASGLLDETLVVVTGEFGRAPRMNTAGGRDHWPGAFSSLLAGAGVDGGRALGATDRHGVAVVDRPVSPSSHASTMLLALGAPAATLPSGRSLAASKRPVDGPLLELWG